MLRINLLKPRFKLFTKPRKEGKDYIVDYGIAYTEFERSILKANKSKGK